MSKGCGKARPRSYLPSGLQNCHPITSDPTIEFAISGGLKAPQ